MRVHDRTKIDPLPSKNKKKNHQKHTLRGINWLETTWRQTFDYKWGRANQNETEWKPTDTPFMCPFKATKRGWFQHVEKCQHTGLFKLSRVSCGSGRSHHPKEEESTVSQSPWRAQREEEKKKVLKEDDKQREQQSRRSLGVDYQISVPLELRRKWKCFVATFGNAL